MNLKESIYLMLLNNELKKNDGDLFRSFFMLDMKQSKKQGCDVMVFSRPDLVDFASELANAIDKNNDNVIID